MVAINLSLVVTSSNSGSAAVISSRVMTKNIRLSNIIAEIVAANGKRTARDIDRIFASGANHSQRQVDSYDCDPSDEEEDSRSLFP